MKKNIKYLLLFFIFNINSADLNEFQFVDIKEDVNNVRDINNWQSYEKDKWTLISQDNLKSNFKQLALSENKEIGIRNLSVYVPKDYIKNKKPLAVFIIHGTFAANSLEYYKPNEIFYENAARFAKELANKERVPVELIAFRWSGYNNSSARKDAGVFLTSILDNYYSDYKIYTIAHSHGCNVVNYSSRILQKAKIDHAIHLSCPVRDAVEKDFKPKNFLRLIQFYSNSDIVATLGAFTTKAILSLSPRKFKVQKNKNVEIYNVRTLLDGSDPGHSNSKDYIVYHLKNIINIIDNNYEFNNDLVMDIKTNFMRKPNIIIAIRNPIDLKIYSEYSGIQKAIKEEENYSNQQKELFKDFYKKDINIKYNVFYRFLSGLYQEAIS